MPRSKIRRKSVSLQPVADVRVKKPWSNWFSRILELNASGPALPHVGRPSIGHLIAALVAAGVYTFVHSFIVWPLFGARDMDYIGHVVWGEAFYHTGRIAMPHFLFQLLIAALYATHLMPSFVFAARLIVVASYAVTTLFFYGALWLLFHQDRRLGRPGVLFAATLAIMAAQPIGRMGWMQVGYLWNEPFNAPTFTLLKPFAVAGFFLTVRFLFATRRLDWRVLAIFFFAIAGGALAKPSYLICLLPAAGMLAVIRWVRQSPMSPVALLIGFALPAIGVLGWQYLQTFSGHRGAVEYHDSIIWAPLRVMRHWTTGIEWKFLVSTAFPFTVLILYGKKAVRDRMLQLAWLTFFFGASYAYLLSEKIRFADGNFIWSAYISLFILFGASVIFLMRQISEARPGSPLAPRQLICIVVLAAHVVSGVLLDKARFLAAMR